MVGQQLIVVSLVSCLLMVHHSCSAHDDEPPSEAKGYYSRPRLSLLRPQHQLTDGDRKTIYDLERMEELKRALPFRSDLGKRYEAEEELEGADKRGLPFRSDLGKRRLF